MYAIIEIKNKQYEIKNNNIIKIEKIKKKSNSYIKPKIILLNIKKEIIIGEKLKKYKIIAKIIKHIKEKKIKIIKFKRRKNHKKKTGHRQTKTNIKVTYIKKVI